MDKYSCFELGFLKWCSYTPPVKSHEIYLDIGGAMAALAFILAIQQLLSPIYQFRLRSHRVELWHITLVIFLGVVSVFIAAIFSNFYVRYDVYWSSPFLWEMIGGALILIAYGFAAYLILKPARIRSFNVITFVRAAATLLSEAKDDDRVKFTSDLARNLKDLFKYASAWQKADTYATAQEFERLRENGEELVIQGKVPIPEEYKIKHKKELEKATFASSFFRILADEKFCKTLVCECPWRTVIILNKISDDRLYVSQAESFIHQLALQAIISENSMMSREVNYDGFGQAPILSESLFKDWFMLRNYRPLSSLRFNSDVISSHTSIKRLNMASRMMLETALENKEYWGAQYMYDVKGAYEDLSRKLGWDKEAKRADQISIDSEWHSGIERMYRMLLTALNDLEVDRKKALFIKEKDSHRDDLVGIIADIVFDSLSSISNNFDGYNGRFWLHAIDVSMNIYPFHDSEPDGMNPLQQQLAIKLIDKLKQNMDGWYPSISRVLLAVIGPYESHPKTTGRSAYLILKDAMYKELQKLPELYKSKPEKIDDFFPENVKYAPKKNTLTHTYSGGSKVITKLNDLKIPDVDFLDEKNWSM